MCRVSLSLSHCSSILKGYQTFKTKLGIGVTHHPDVDTHTYRTYIQKKKEVKQKNERKKDLHWVGGIPVNVAEPVSRCGRLADKLNEQQQEVDDHFG